VSRVETHTNPQGREIVRVTYPWHEVQQTWREAVSPDQAAATVLLDTHGLTWQNIGPHGDHFYGLPVDETKRYLAQGYDHPDSLTGEVFPFDYGADAPTFTWNEDDGDYMHEEWLGGGQYYLDRQIQPTKPGLTIQATVDFNCGVDGKVIAEYGDWVGGALRAIQNQGFDCAVSVRFDATYVWGYSDDRILELVIPVTQFGETSIPRDYAILFTHTGFRQFCFSAIMRTGVEMDCDVSGSLGTPYGADNWGVEYDPDTRVLHLTCDSRARSFPADEMTAMLREVSGQFDD
jgi:hypothetical protein